MDETRIDKNGFRVFGYSRFGGNGVEAQGSSADAPVRDTAIQKIMLVFDRYFGVWTGEQRKKELEDERFSVEDNRRMEEEERFRTQAGFTSEV